MTTNNEINEGLCKAMGGEMKHTAEYISMCEKLKPLQEGWEPEVGDCYCYQDVMCGFPIYYVRPSNLQDFSKTDAMKDKPSCMICQYDFDTFQEAMGQSCLEKWDVLSGRCVFLPSLEYLFGLVWHDPQNEADPFLSIHMFTLWLAENQDQRGPGVDMKLLVIQFIALELWNLKWNTEKGEWE